MTAAGLLGLAGMIVFGWKIGPVILVLTATHGVHVGDVLAGPPALAAVGLVGYRPALGRSRRTSTATSTTPTIPRPRAHQDGPVTASAAVASANSAI